MNKSEKLKKLAEDLDLPVTSHSPAPSKAVDEYEYEFEHKGRKAVVMFDVLSLGKKASNSRPGPYDDDPYGYEGEAPEMELHGAYYLDGQEEEIKDLSDEELEALKDKAIEAYSDQMDN